MLSYRNSVIDPDGIKHRHIYMRGTLYYVFVNKRTGKRFCIAMCADPYVW